MKSKIVCFVLFAMLVPAFSLAWLPMAVDTDPLVRMPGTQPNPAANITAPADDQAAGACVNCHWGNPVLATDQGMPGFAWQGSMMAQAARDPIFWATMTVAAQDSIWAIGRPNATDLCLRCHFPQGWMSDRSDDVSGGMMTGGDFDGVHCDVCHSLYDPFFTATANGARGETDWDEAVSASISQQVTNTKAIDWSLASGLTFFNGNPFYNNATEAPLAPDYTENGGGQMFMESTPINPQAMRGPFADAAVDTETHDKLYSRYHKSKFFCSTCHDVSNPVLANLGADLANPLPSEVSSAFSYAHVERTFSEFMSSAYGSTPGGVATNAEFQAQGGAGITNAAMCQDCHMADVNGVTAASGGGVVRPNGSTDHLASGVPSHDLQGGNSWITYILASTDDSLPIFDQTNFDIMTQGPAALTLDMTQGISPHLNSNGEALLDASERAKQQLVRAGSIKNLVYNELDGSLTFQVQNNTGHKLLSGYPEGRRMFVNIKAFQNGALIHEVNPYDMAAGTFVGGLSHWNYDGQQIVPNPSPLGPNQVYDDALVYEANTMSTLTGEDHSFHFALATGRYKDNRIPPKGFDLATAITRLAEPVAPGGISDSTATPETNLYSAAEFLGGYDDVSTTIAAGADQVVVTLNYQGTSREYIEFLRDEINGTGANRALYGPDNGAVPTYAQANGLNPTSADNAYLAQTDSFFDSLRAWGPAIWQLWYHNHGLDGSGPMVSGIVPFEMARAQAGFGLTSPNGGETITAGETVQIVWSPHPDANSYRLFYFDANLDPHLIGPQNITETSFLWNVPSTVLAEDGKLLRVTALDNLNQVLGFDWSDGHFTVEPALQALFPNGGETLLAGTTTRIQWVAPTGANSYRLFYFDASMQPHHIADVGNVNNYQWAIPLSNVAGVDNRLRVTAFDQTGARLSVQWSEGSFAIASQLYPNGGEILTEGQTYQLTWAPVSGADNYNLFYFDADNTPHFITNVTNANPYNWTIPLSATAETGKRFRITPFAGAEKIESGIQWSDGTFEIAPALYPDGGEVLVVGNNYKLTWAPVIAATKYNLFYFDSDLTPHFIDTVFGATTYDWTVPDDAVLGNGKRYRVTPFNGTERLSSNVQWSDGTFDIVTPTP